MADLKKMVLIVLENAIAGRHADHHAFVLVNGVWQRNRGNDAAAYAEILAMAERFSA